MSQNLCDFEVTHAYTHLHNITLHIQNLALLLAVKRLQNENRHYVGFVENTLYSFYGVLIALSCVFEVL